jgi:RNA polymerase sigma factor for flagellar operon FliA
MDPPPPTREQLINQTQGLVHSLASGIARSLPVRADMEDLVAYGELGLAQAARDFDPAYGVAFTTFAYHRIRGAIYDGLAQMTWTSRAQYRRLRHLQMAEEVVAQDAQSAPVQGRESLESGVRWLRSVTDQLAAVFLTSQGDDGRGIRDSAIEDPRATGATIVAQQEISQRLHRLIDELPDIERRLIKSVYLDGATLQLAAQSLGISKSWASRLHAKALGGLARSLKRLGADV